VQSSFLPALTRTAALYNALKGSSSNVSDFNLIFNAALSVSGALDANSREILFGVAGDPNFGLAGFLQVLPKTANLYRAFQAGCPYRVAFNTMYLGSVPASGNLTDTATRTMLFNITGDPAFNQQAFLSDLLVRDPFAVNAC
jgi:hypothetical protein